MWSASSPAKTPRRALEGRGEGVMCPCEEDAHGGMAKVMIRWSSSLQEKPEWFVLHLVLDEVAVVRGREVGR